MQHNVFFFKFPNYINVNWEHINMICAQRTLTGLSMVNDSNTMTRYEDWCHPWADHHPITGAAFSLPSPHTHLAAACFASTCGKHLHRWSLCFFLAFSLSLHPPDLLPPPYSVSLSPYIFLFLCRKGEVLIVNMKRCQCQKKRAAYFWIQAARFTEAYFYHEKPTWNGTAMRSCWSNLL